MAFFGFEAVWIALSAVYPQAFDEDFHFGLIKLYSHYWLPFLASQPPHADALGAVARDPSYLYHYVMSFPYRLLALGVHSQTAQVIILRLIDVGLFASGLVLFRQVLLRARISQTLTHISLLLFVLIPIVPQLAAQINYDDLLLPLIAWTCLLTFQAVDELQKRKPSAKTLLTLGSVCLFTGLVKYVFLPIFLAVVIFLLYVAYRSFDGRVKLLASRVWGSWRRQSRLTQVVCGVLFIVSLGLFIERDGVNLVRYHTLNPDCSAVLSIQACEAYGPWDYTYTTHQIVEANAGIIDFDNPVQYSAAWVYWILYRLFFAINGPDSSFTSYPPLPLPTVAAILIAIAGVIAVFKWRRQIFRGNPYIAFFFVASVLYLASLFVEGYSQYHYTDELINMNGRYLLPVLLLLGAIVGRAFSLALHNSLTRKTVLAVLAMLLFLQGGGFLTFITRSDASWDWPNTAVVHANNAARRLTHRVIVKGSKTYSTRVWLFN